jgi:hypothetical protein
LQLNSLLSERQWCEWPASALFSLSLGCWVKRQDAAGWNAALASMLIYNLLVTLYSEGVSK